VGGGDFGVRSAGWNWNSDYDGDYCIVIVTGKIWKAWCWIEDSLMYLGCNSYVIVRCGGGVIHWPSWFG
jgi:hypothetical protein